MNMLHCIHPSTDGHLFLLFDYYEECYYEHPWYMRSCFSHAVFHILSLSFKSLTMMYVSKCRSFWVYPAWNLLSFLICRLMIFLRSFWKILSHYFFYIIISITFSSSSRILIMSMLVLSMMSHGSLRLY